MRASFNRTTMELKQKKLQNTKRQLITTFNRTTMELKPEN